MSSPNDRVELRGMYERDLMEALDMIALARGMTRTDYVGRLLRQHVASKQREASLIAKGPQINPPVSDSQWSALE